jgi:ribosome-associated protein YbcJ (S4-like RNA binding protein)
MLENDGKYPSQFNQRSRTCKRVLLRDLLKEIDLNNSGG